MPRTLIVTPPEVKSAPTGVAELVLLDEVREFPDNLKIANAGKAFADALDASIKDAGFIGALTLTPRVTLEGTPKLARAYGADGRYLAGDGNLRLTRLGRLGYNWILVLPQPEDDGPDGQLAAIQAIIAAGPQLLATLRDKVRSGEKVARGYVNPRLTTPQAVLRLVLGAGRGIRSFDESLVASAVESLLEDRDEPQDPALILALAVKRSAAIKDVLNKQKQAAREEQARAEAEAKAALELSAATLAAQEAAKATDGDLSSAGETAKGPPKLSIEAQAVAQKQKQRADARRLPVGPFFMTADGAALLETLVRNVKTHVAQPGREGRLLTVLELAARVLEVDADAEVKAFVARVQAAKPKDAPARVAAFLAECDALQAEQSALVEVAAAACQHYLEVAKSEPQRR